ncbi:MAG: hydrogenase iron-sulfur subunit [Candidatus Hodarchaeota archaeon]
MKIGTFLCNCGGSLKNIDWNELQNFMKEKAGAEDFCVYHENLCSSEGKTWFKETINRENPDSIVFGGCTPKTAGYLFEDTLKELNISPFQVVGANLREHIGWITHEKEPATRDAKAALLGAYNKASFESPVEPQKIEISQATVVIGAGPAGLQAAQDLAEKGHTVHLIDRNPYIGGNAAKLGTFFPSEDCATCMPSVGLKGLHQQSVRRCHYRSAFDLHPNIKLYMKSEVTGVNGAIGNYAVTVNTKPTYVKMDRCVNCGLCAEVCPVDTPDEINLGLITRKAAHVPLPHSTTTKYVINREECPEGCTECVKACPVDAIDLDMKEQNHEITAGGFILATGFEEYDPKLVEEYHYGMPGYENVITQSELARLLDLTGPSVGRLIKKDGSRVESLVIVNCVGSRSQKYNIWCSNICCMIGIKHAIKIKENFPKIDVTCCYIDIRAVGANYEEFYNKARDLGVKFVRGRPAEIESDGKYLYVYAEDSQADEMLTIKTDMAVLSMSMVPSPGIKELAEKLKIDIDDSGYFKSLYSKFKTTETKQAGVFVAGTAISPADIPTTKTRAGYAASHLDMLLSKGTVEKRFSTAEIENEKCTLCEICITACPFGAIEAVEVANPGIKVQVSPTVCVGCGQCASSCPASAISINYYAEDQILAQVEGLLYDAKENPDPIIVTFACWECAYSATDALGMSANYRPKTTSHLKAAQFDEQFKGEIAGEYPHNVRILPLQCTGNVSARLIQQTFAMGADGIIVLGCYEDKCHYETGSKASSIRVDVLKSILESVGIDPRRLEKQTTFFMSCDRFALTAKKMTNRLKKLGKLER